MSSSSGNPHEMYLPTGWRVVGSGAAQIAERAAAQAAGGPEPGHASDTLYAVQCTMAPAARGRPAVERMLDAITEEIRRTWPECPRLLRDAPAERTASRFGGLRFDVDATPGKQWLGEVVWRAVHPMVAGAPVTTQAMLEECASYTRLTVRVTADHGLSSVRGFVGAGQAQPSFLNAIRQDGTLAWMGGPISVHTIGVGEIEGFVKDVLERETRSLPVVVQAPHESGEFVVDPDDLMWELLGRARLHVIRDHRLTYRLSDTVGDRRMSCYWGAARCYMPGWSRHDDPLDHPLLVADRLADPLMRAAWRGELGVFLGSQVVFPPSIQDRRIAAEARSKPALPSSAKSARALTDGQTDGVELSSARGADARAAAAHGATAHEAAASTDGAAAQDDVSRRMQPDLTPLLQTLVDEVRGLGSMVRQLNDEVERLRTISSVRSSSTTAIERRLGRLEDLLELAFPDGSADAPGASHADDVQADDEAHARDEDLGPALVDVVQDAAETWSDALVFLGAAHTAARDSPYEDPERVRAILEAMARVARRRRDGSLGTSLRDAFGDLGIDYRAAIARNTPARLREQYRFTHDDGTVVEAEEHIVLGNTYDPRRCLRIYFSSRAPNEPRFVIAHVGRHFEVKTTT